MEEGSRKKDQKKAMVTLLTSPFLGEKGRLNQLGWWRGRRKPQKWRCYMIKSVIRPIGAIGAVLMGIILSVIAAMAEETTGGGMPTDLMSAYKTIGLGAAAAVAISATVIGAAYAVGRIGSAALGAAAEKPELLTRSLLFVALAEGLAVLGFAIAMMLIQKI
jgi:V/A-type H+/Na+-transporting ATPase subunit K